MPMEFIDIHLTDLEDVRDVLAACLNYFSARDFQQAQIAFGQERPSPLTSEIDRVKTRFDGYMSDFILARYEEERAGDSPADDGVAEDGSEELTEASEELSGAPLGEPKPKRQRGRRLTAEELSED